MASAVSCRRKTGNPNIYEYEGRAAGAANEVQPGDLVKLDSNGEIVIATTGAILGIALKAASTTDSTLIPVDVLRSGDVFSIPLNTTTAENNRGAEAAFTFTTGAQVVTVGSGDCYIVGHDTIDAFKDGGRVLVTVKATSLTLR